jgi:DNA-binding NtrC family response regulator
MTGGDPFQELRYPVRRFCQIKTREHHGPMTSVLIVHSDAKTADLIESVILELGAAPTVVGDESNALDVLSQQSFPLVVVGSQACQDIEIFLNQLKIQHPESPSMVVSPDQSARAAKHAMHLGAADYLTEPLDRSELTASVKKLLQTGPDITIEDLSQGRYDHIVGHSKPIKDVFRLVDKVAATDSTVMIYGESGTGKELVARAIHQNSPRRQNPLIPVNCGAIPEELLESELFGHEKGAFTSAIRTRIGRFEMADGGTIFLDEIADMSPRLQVKILRVLQEHEFERIGGTKTINVNIRVITATNKNLRDAVEGGRFREDLFYRLNVIPITVPPLRDRHADIPLLVEHFLDRFQQTRGDDVTGIDNDAMAKLMAYEWPGNIRELENIIERMVILAENQTLSVRDLPPRISQAVPSAEAPGVIEITDDGIDFNQVVSDFENQLLIQALEKSDWVKNKAAKLLKLNRTTLVEKLKKKKIQSPD